MKIETIHHRGKAADVVVGSTDYAVIVLTDGAAGGQLVSIEGDFAAAKASALFAMGQSPTRRIGIFRATAIYEAEVGNGQ